MATPHSLEGPTKWLHREEWRDAFDELLERHLGPACAKSDIAIDELPAHIDDHSLSVLWGCVVEDFLARDLDGGRNIADEYLKRRGWKESASNRAYIAALRASVMSLYEVSDIVLDESFLARDLVRGGEPVRVSERLATRSLKPWDRIAARVVQVRTRTEMAGGALPFEYRESETILKLFRRAAKKARKDVDTLVRQIRRGIGSAPNAEALCDTGILRNSAFLFTNIWLADLLQRTLNPTLPQMCNSDGDELLFTTVSYPLQPGAGADAIRAALAEIPMLHSESETFWNWIEPQNRASKKRPADGTTFITTLDDGSLVLGSVELKANRLVLEANSHQRAERGRALIEPVLQALVGEPLVETRTVAQFMAERPAGTPKPVSSGLSPNEEAAVLRATVDGHYEDLLDEPVPMLGDITPLQAATTAKGRKKLAAWLKFMENATARRGSGSLVADYDFSWMWEKLGVADLRR